MLLDSEFDKEDESFLPGFQIGRSTPITISGEVILRDVSEGIG
jgi:hypothetical protein